MADSDRIRWEQKYAGRKPLECAVPDEWLASCVVERISGESGRSLDLACGTGHNAVWLAQHGWDVDGYDISPRGLKLAKQLADSSGVSVNWKEFDIDSSALADETWDLICVFRFLDRRRLPRLVQSAMKPAGYVIFETFLAVEGEESHIRNPDWLLEAGELPKLFPELKVIAYEDVTRDSYRVARYCGQKPPS